MTSRTRFLIMAVLFCHQLVSAPLVTSQLRPAAAQDNASGPLPNAPSPGAGEEVTITALEQEKQGAIYKLRGNAEIRYGVYTLQADEMAYNSDTGEATADGHIVLAGGPNDEHIEAGRGSYNLRAETGRFEDVRGTIGIELHGNRLQLTSSNPFFFTGKVVEKTGPDHYRVYDGAVTACEGRRPRWEFSARKVVVEVGGNARIYHSTFAIRGVPILYFPFATFPAQRLPRQSGFLLPNFGTSSVKGSIFGASLFWAINRSMDVHLGAEYFSARGWAPQGEFRARPSESSFVDVSFFSVLDRGRGRPPVDEGGTELHVRAEGELPHNFRGVADIDYLSSFVFRLVFTEVFSQVVNSEVRSVAFLSNTSNGLFYNASVRRYQDFEGTGSGNVVSILHAPSVELSSVDRELGSSPFYWSYDAAAEGLSRSEPGFSTAALLGRFDLSPTVSAPFLLHGWSFRPAVSLRETFYTQQLQPSGSGTGLAVSDPVSRKDLDASIEVRPPALHRVFDRQFLGRKWKHVIEPRVTYDYVTGVSNFANILRFDERDILTDTNELEYAVVNRLYAKRMSPAPRDCGAPGMPLLFIGGAVQQNRFPWERQATPQEAPCPAEPEVREIVTWELGQKYYVDPTFGGAFVAGRSNVFTGTADLTGISFLTEGRHLSPLVSRLRVQSSKRTDIEWDLDYDFKQSRINASTALVNYHFGSFTVGGGDAYLQVPGETLGSNSVFSPQVFNQFRLLLGYGHSNKRGFSAATNVGVDANLGFLQYAAVQTTYNWDCCGVNVEFRRFALGSIRNENQYRFTFALANLGSLGNLRRAERLF